MLLLPTDRDGSHKSDLHAERFFLIYADTWRLRAACAAAAAARRLRCAIGGGMIFLLSASDITAASCA